LVEAKRAFREEIVYLRRIFSIQNAAMIGVATIAALVPLLLGTNQYNMVLATTVMLYAVLASAWNIIGGMAGQLDLAVGAYVGVGAFTSGTLLIRWNITPWIGMPLGGLVAVGVAVLIGFPMFRFKIKEVWYAMVSVALVEVMRVLFMMWGAVGGPTERYLPIDTWSWYHLRFNTYMPYYYILLVGLVIVLIVNRRIRDTKLGYSLLALGEDEDAVEVLGVDVRTAKLKALMIYAFIAGMVGGLYANIYGFIHPTFFAVDMSVEVMILGIVGGMGITAGPVTAAIILVIIREYLRAKLGGEFVGLYLVVYAVVLIMVALYQPRGLVPLFTKGWERLNSYLRARQHERRVPTSVDSK
jgi:branched-chain amino acid transport system permease protein